MTRKAVPLVVYIVDDDDAVRNGFARLIRSAGLDARPFGSAHEFLAGVRDQPLACILLDISLPQLTGLQIQEELNQRGIQLPVITISAREDDETRLWARDLGAKLFLRKPVDDQALLDAISWVTGTAQGR
ncbi:MAG TPA: response regulator [Arenimonas sp.]|nr:response regulator [Arenimonas sp.]